jgi:hypothetical protein
MILIGSQRASSAVDAKTKTRPNIKIGLHPKDDVKRFILNLLAIYITLNERKKIKHHATGRSLLYSFHVRHHFTLNEKRIPLQKRGSKEALKRD